MNDKDTTQKNFSGYWKSSLMIMIFGFGILAYLIAIGRQEWFTIKPATGTARALSYASDGGQSTRR